MFFGKTTATLSGLKLLAIVLAIIGMPLMIMGIMGLLIRRNDWSDGNASNVELEVARIRFSAETESMKNNLKGK